MKVLSTEGLTKLIQLIKSSFISTSNTVTTNTVTLADVATSGDFDDLNITDSAKVMMSSMGMPSDKYINLTLGASGSTYTAPANGWFCVSASTVNATGGYVSNVTPSYGGRIMVTAYGYSYGGAVVPVLKGQNIIFYYENGVSSKSIKFVYAVGSESEAQ